LGGVDAEAVGNLKIKNRKKRLKEVSADEKGRLIQVVAHCCGQEAITQQGKSAIVMVLEEIH